MNLIGSELRWYSPTTGKKYMIEISDVRYVERGKRTHNFQKKSSADALDGRCFSLVCQSTTVDLEVDTEADRDAMVDCFHTIIDKLVTDKRSDHSSEQNLKL